MVTYKNIKQPQRIKLLYVLYTKIVASLVKNAHKILGCPSFILNKGLFHVANPFAHCLIFAVVTSFVFYCSSIFMCIYMQGRVVKSCVSANPRLIRIYPAVNSTGLKTRTG